jgi:hyperosmotically inducible protein
MRTIALIVTLFLAGGCTALAVGGAGVVGYQLGKDERSASVVAEDSAITTKIKGKYVADDVVSVFNIGVRTYEGTVTLTGTVGSIAARNRAVGIAKATGGVLAVDDRIRIEDRSNN